MSLCGIGPEAGWVQCIPRDARRSAKTGAMLRIEIAGRERRVSTSQLPSVAHVLMKIGVPRACTAKACASRGSGLGSSSRNRIPRGPVPRRPALTVYRGGAGQGGSVQPNCHL
ncbi:hypothetical protein F2Q69_00009259 [Brassica cretica]|uniref:Uncharacterized protein n=1 Tax=Brassica cretica TaxID=69181 RepID=A0A8S9P7B7_BRACR|nr:hypothetical protein F2Q69_00009259 [Brassica cretica]